MCVHNIKSMSFSDKTLFLTDVSEICVLSWFFHGTMYEALKTKSSSYICIYCT